LHRRADGSDVEVSSFALDATEVTWSTFARCVAAGACLPNQPTHPARVALDDVTLDLRTPVVGLLPVEAEQLCTWLHKRLPTDDEWDFAAADRGPGTRARYPFDTLADVVECRESTTGALAANHQAHGRDCPGVPLPVGTYTSSLITRGAGSALADLAGNVAEWTRVPGTSTLHPDFPARTDEVDVRGGGASSFVELLENDVALRVQPTLDADVIHQRLLGLAKTTGVRCASDAAIDVVEPSCPTP
jgi:formylglycine-generating enzyme required for sulfatase activity